LLLLAVDAGAQVTLPEGEGKSSGRDHLRRLPWPGDRAVDSNRTEAEWKKVVDTMASRGAEGTDEEFAAIVKYLAKYFGKKRSVFRCGAKTSASASRH
jgi:hypothetical protein